MTVHRVPRRHVFHVHHGLFYYVEDSLRGVLLALARLFGWIDLDIQKTRDGVLIVAHGSRPLSGRLTGGFRDPKGLIHRSSTYADLTWAEVERLRSNDDKGYRIWRADELIPLALSKGLKVEADAKTPHITVADWNALRCAIVFEGQSPAHLQVKAFPKFARSLKAAHNTGFKTIVLLHTAEEAKVPTAAQKFIDYFRGRTPVWT